MGPKEIWASILPDQYRIWVILFCSPVSDLRRNWVSDLSLKKTVGQRSFIPNKTCSDEFTFTSACLYIHHRIHRAAGDMILWGWKTTLAPDSNPPPPQTHTHTPLFLLDDCMNCNNIFCRVDTYFYFAIFLLLVFQKNLSVGGLQHLSTWSDFCGCVPAVSWRLYPDSRECLEIWPTLRFRGSSGNSKKLLKVKRCIAFTNFSVLYS